LLFLLLSREPMADAKRDYWEGRGVEYDDRAPRDNEALPAPPAAPSEGRRRDRQWLRDMGGPDRLDARWTQGGERGWLSVRDPFTGERHEVPTKYADRRPPEGTDVAPQSWVRRAMEKLPPRPPRPPRPKRGAR
jgi:hypothetical protein